MTFFSTVVIDFPNPLSLYASSCFYDFPHFILSQDAVANEFYNMPHFNVHYFIGYFFLSLGDFMIKTNFRMQERNISKNHACIRNEIKEQEIY